MDDPPFCHVEITVNEIISRKRYLFDGDSLQAYLTFSRFHFPCF